MVSPRAATLAAFAQYRCSAILRSDDAAVVAPALQAAIDGGIRIVEVTMTTPDCLDHIAALSERQDLVVGAGTVLSLEDAKDAMGAGARFLVSPVVDPQLISFCRQHELVSVPGTFTPTEMMHAHRAGADLIKLFPGPANGAEYLKALRGPMPFLKVFPTSGVTEDNIGAWLDAGAFGLGFVASLFVPEDLAARRFDAIRDRAARMLAKVEAHTKAASSAAKTRAALGAATAAAAL
ncbi:MAG: bifunctional 4-hydroxy-2-oxoglutarate aldolase/2-dehydro-3-deoxy-phosphogluconate aldolase [Planctomycetes bacterium]|nr:bifunctional 4-hydroxy-2-oxoglutarate aldolase/2-dehydro-3-deoxy-phosphogluconate aldolase [Planctomycetota bacterium]MCB9885206.1 bifunctional 4-hydroxy-2-oxoglutarate aldolase/2-dehydro-3-deoxy-phosphogluconate aldolase [Planctomycetota bacterium]